MTEFGVYLLERTNSNTEKFYCDLKAFKGLIVLHADLTALTEDLDIIAMYHIQPMQTHYASKLINDVLNIDEDNCYESKSDNNLALSILNKFHRLLSLYIPKEY